MLRLAGLNAVGTSVTVSMSEFPQSHSAPGVVLARSDQFADALAGGPLAASVQGPLLITPGAKAGAQLDPHVLDEIQRVLKPGGTVYILGGPSALGGSIDTTLGSLGYSVKRIYGDNRYETAVAIAQQLGNPGTVFEATGRKFADALSAVPAAIQQHGAILLTDGNEQDAATAAYLDAHPADTRFAVGGPAAAAGADPTATAIYGKDTYATSAAVAARFFPAALSFGAATASNFPDALSGGVFEGTSAAPGPMLLVPSSGPLPSAVVAYLMSQVTTITKGMVFGGQAAVSNETWDQLALLIGAS
jgi:hypothetical protein